METEIPKNNNLEKITTHHHFVFILGGFLLGVIVGLGSFYLLDSGTTGEALNRSDAESYEALKQEVRTQYPEYFETDNLGTFYSGTVQEVKDDSIVIKTDIPEIVLLASDLKETREVQIDENTQIIKETQKDLEQYNREFAEYEVAFREYEQQLNNLSEDGTIDAELDITEPLFPSDVEEKEISVGEIEPGERVSISVRADEALAGAEDVLDEVNQAPNMTTIIRVQEELADEVLPEDTETIEGELAPEEGVAEPEGEEGVIEPEGAESATAEPADI